jgi:hypothetical protein
MWLWLWLHRISEYVESYWESSVALLIVTISKCTVNPISKPNPVYSDSISFEILHFLSSLGQCGFLFSCIPTKILNTFLISAWLLHATCYPHWFGGLNSSPHKEECRSCSFQFCNVLPPSITSILIGPCILCDLISKHSLFCSREMKNKSHTYTKQQAKLVFCIF